MPDFCFLLPALFLQSVNELDEFGVGGFGFPHSYSTFSWSSNSFSCLSSILVASCRIRSGGNPPVDSMFMMNMFFSHSTLIGFGSVVQASTQSMQRLQAKRSRTSIFSSLTV